MFGVKFITENSKEFFKFEWVRRVLVLLLINLVNEMLFHMCMSFQNVI